MDQPGKVASPARDQLNIKNGNFPCPRSCLRIWSRETGSVVSSHVSLLIPILEAESGAYLLTGFLPSCATASIYSFITAIRHRVSLEYIGSRNCVPMAFTARESAGTGPVNLEVVPNECCLGRSPWTN